MYTLTSSVVITTCLQARIKTDHLHCFFIPLSVVPGAVQRKQQHIKEVISNNRVFMSVASVIIGSTASSTITVHT